MTSHPLLSNLLCIQLWSPKHLLSFSQSFSHTQVWSPQASPRPRPSGFVPGCIALMKGLLFLVAFLRLVPLLGVHTLFTDNYRALPGVMK